MQKVILEIRLIYWNLLLKFTGWISWWDKAISSWYNLICSFQVISGMRIMNYMKKATALIGYSHATVKQLPQRLLESFALLPFYFINCLSLVSPTMHTFSLCPNNSSISLIPSWEHFSYLGAKGLQSTCSTFPQHPRVKGFTPPRNLPVTWKHIQDRAQTSC